MEQWYPYDLDDDVKAVLIHVASKGDGGYLIDDLLELDKELEKPLWHAARMGWLMFRAKPEDSYGSINVLDTAEDEFIAKTKGAFAKISDIGLVLLELHQVNDQNERGSDRYTARLRMSDFGHLAENCLGAEWELHLIATRYLPRGLGDDDFTIRLEHQRGILNHRIWEDGIELARSWCETLAKYPEFACDRQWLRELRQELGEFAKMNPVTGTGGNLKSMECLRESIDGWRTVSPPTGPDPTKTLSPEERDLEILKLLREHPNATSKVIAAELGCSAGTVRGSSAWNQVQQRKKNQKSTRPRKGGNSKQKSLDSIPEPAQPEEPEESPEMSEFLDGLPEEDREDFEQTDTEFGTRGGPRR